MSNIEWTDETANVIVVKGEDGQPHGWYCEKVSEGCQHCYAERLNQNEFFGGNHLPYAQSRAGRPELMLRTDILESWFHRRKPKRIFVNSMTDTFGEFVPITWIFQLLDAMVAAPILTFQVLTKRVERAQYVVLTWLRERGLGRVPDNIWLGFSAENQQRYDERVEWMMRLPALIFVSCEPLIGSIDLRLTDEDWPDYVSDGNPGKPIAVPSVHGQLIDWVIVGGESGADARPMHPEWAMSIRDQCQVWLTPFFFKQWGEWLPYSLGSHTIGLDGSLWKGKHSGINIALVKKVGKKVAGRSLDGREWNEFPEVSYG